MTAKGLATIRESMSQSSLGHNLYEVRSVPRREPIPDTSKQERLERELVERVFKSSKIRTLERILKYVAFVAIAPFYYGLYRAPKYVIDTLRPPLHKIKKSVLHYTARISKTLNLFVDLILHYQKSLSNSYQNIKKRIRQFLRQKYQAVLARIRLFFLPIYNAYKVVARYLRMPYDVYVFLKQKIIGVFKPIRQAINAKIELLHTLRLHLDPNKLIKLIKEIIEDPRIILRKLAAVSAQLKSLFLPNKIQEKRVIEKKRIDTPSKFDVIQHRFISYENQFKTLCKDKTAPVRNALNQFEMFTENCEKKYLEIEERISKRRDAALDYFEGKIMGLQKLLSTFFSPIQTKTHSCVKAVKLKFRKIPSFFNFVSLALDSLSNNVEKAFYTCRKKIGMRLAFLSRGSNLARNYLKKLGLKTQGFAKKVEKRSQFPLLVLKVLPKCWKQMIQDISVEIRFLLHENA